MKIENAKLTTILDLMLCDQFGLTDCDYGVRDSLIFIASQGNFEEIMEVRVYECSDFAVPATVKSPIHAPVGRMTGPVLGGFSVPSNPRRVVQGQGNTPLQGTPNPKIVQGGNRNARIESQKTAETGNQGGTSLLVKQSIKNHDRIEELLRILRRTKN